MTSQIWYSPTARLLMIIVLALIVRLYRITNPISDWHAFRQADTASVTREYIKNGVDILRPHYHDLANIQSGKDNLEGYRMVEFPIVNAGLAWLIRSLPFLPLDITSRVASVVSSLGTLIVLYLLVKRLSGLAMAELSALVFALLPYAIYYSRAILPEPYMLFFSTAAIYVFTLWLDKKKWVYFILSAILLALALLLKPFVAFLAPVWAVLLWQKWRWQIWKHPELIIYGVISILPTWWWRNWIEAFPSGIPASDWLFNGNGIRWRPAWFRWLGWERLTKLMLGYAGVLLIPAWLMERGKDFWVYLSWWIGIGVYASVIATGNVQHDYYQNLMVPILVITLAKGMIQARILLMKWVTKDVAFGVVALVALMGWLGSWQMVKGYFNVNHWEYVEAGAAVDRLVPADAKVIAPAFGDTQFLYQTNRTGWPIGFNIEDKIAKGATHYVTTSDDDEARELQQKYRVIEKTEKYLIIDLRQKATP